MAEVRFTEPKIRASELQIPKSRRVAPIYPPILRCFAGNRRTYENEKNETSVSCRSTSGGMNKTAKPS